MSRILVDEQCHRACPLSKEMMRCDRKLRFVPHPAPRTQASWLQVPSSENRSEAKPCCLARVEVNR